MLNFRKHTVGIGALSFVVVLGLRISWVPGVAFAADMETEVLAKSTFDLERMLLTVPVTIGNGQYRFALATSHTSVLSAPFAKRLPRLPPDIDQRDEPFQGFYFRRAPQAFISGLPLQFPTRFVECGHTDACGDHFVRIDGVIGLDVLAQHLVEIDFDSGTIRFLKSVPKDAGERLAISTLQKQPRMCAVVIKAQCCDGQLDDFYVDLENPDAISLCWPAYRRFLEKKQIRRLHSESTFGTNQCRQCIVGTATSMRLGHFETTNVRANVAGDNIIGLGYLSRFVVTFDFPNGSMYIRPGKRFRAIDGQDVSGLFAKWKQNSLEVVHCEAGGPADNAGIQVGDVVIAVDGLPVSRDTQATFRSKLRLEGTSLQMQVKRDGTVMNVNLKLEPAPGKVIDNLDQLGAPLPEGNGGFQPRTAPHELPDRPQPEETEKEEGAVIDAKAERPHQKQRATHDPDCVQRRFAILP